MAVGGIKPNVAAESGMWRMKGLMTRDGTAEHVSTDQILRRERTGTGTGKHIFPVQLTTSRIDNLTRLIDTLLL